MKRVISSSSHLAGDSCDAGGVSTDAGAYEWENG